MRFNAEQLALLAAPKKPVELSPRSRSSLYDWEGALTALAGELSQGLLIPDAFEHGAQAKIEAWLADWFASNFDAEPHESTTRPKAKRVWEAVARAQKAGDAGEASD